MAETRTLRPAFVIGPSGQPVTLENLPSGNDGRWIARRKAELIAAIDGGLLTIDEACARYALTIEELANWKRHFERAGVAGLKATRSKGRKSSLDG